MQRNEIKFKLNNYNLIIFKNKTKLFSAFPQRKIFSIYFDTFDFKDFIDSEEGTVPRKKIRLRYYNSTINFLKDKITLDGTLEIKKTFDSYREKKTIKINKSLKDSVDFTRNFLNKKRYPNCAISYDRNYFKSIDGTRITIDKNIKYYRIDSNLNFHSYGIETDNIIEMKLEDINRISSLDNDFLSAYRVRFSKYCQAVRKIKLIN